MTGRVRTLRPTLQNSTKPQANTDLHRSNLVLNMTSFRFSPPEIKRISMIGRALIGGHIELTLSMERALNVGEQHMRGPSLRAQINVSET